VNSEVRRYRLARSLRGERYNTLIEYAVERDFVLGLAIRLQLRQSANLTEVVARLGPWQLDREQVDAWPGTRLAESAGEAAFLTFECTVRCGEVLTSEAESLWQWRQPELPEDPCFLREDHRPFFFSVTHEKEAFVDADREEIAELHSRGLKYFLPLGRERSSTPAIPE
jgi:hypothetical protein